MGAASLVLGLGLIAILSPSPSSGQTAQSKVLFKVCARDDPNVGQCLDQAIQYGISSLANGDDQMKLPKLDPLTVEKVTLLSGSQTLDLLNYDVTGLQNVVCENSTYSANGKEFELSFDLRVPQFKAAGSYRMDRYFLGSPKPNSGTFTVGLDECQANFVVKGVISKKDDGREYATISGISSNFKGGANPSINFNNLSVGRNRLWNREPQDILQAYKTAIDQVHPELVSAFANLIFQNVPFDVLFPPTLRGGKRSPYAFQSCASGTSTVNECLTQAIQIAIRDLKDGYAPLGLSKLSPMNMEKVSLKSTDGKNLDLLNYDVTGLEGVVCENASYTSSGNALSLSFDLKVPLFSAAGSYVMDRYFLGSPKPNSGTFTLSLSDYLVNFVLDGTVAEGSDGKKYASMSGVSSSFNGGKNPAMYFTNLSTGRNKLWNREPAEILQAYKTAIDKVQPALVATYANLIFKSVPIDQMFPATI